MDVARPDSAKSKEKARLWLESGKKTKNNFTGPGRPARKGLRAE